MLQKHRCDKLQVKFVMCLSTMNDVISLKDVSIL